MVLMIIQLLIVLGALWVGPWCHFRYWSGHPRVLF